MSGSDLLAAMPKAESRRFLRFGTRGFYATFAGNGAVTRTGDSVFLLD